jgi:exosortase/archaeosortase family protein
MTQGVFEPAGRPGRWTGARNWVREEQRRWQSASPRTRTAVQLAVLVTVVVIAYNYSFTTLVQTAGLDTPLAYVSLVPVIALALAAVRARPRKPEPAIHDRQVDYIVGVPLVGAALAVNVLLPGKLSAMFWVWRIDLLTLPFFVAGAVAIIFGVRVLWRQKLAVGYLFLAWPLPYQSVLLRLLHGFTAATIDGLKVILKVLHVAKPAGSFDNTLFVVVHNGHSFPLNVVSACSGVNSVVGFLLVGSAFGAVVRGPKIRKTLWLVGGMLLLWVFNLVRVTFIFWAGRTWGEHVAIDVLHPFVGLVSFSLGVLVMVLLIRPLGMHLGIAEPAVPTLPPDNTVRSKISLAVPKVFMAVVVVLVAALVLGVDNLSLRSFNLVANASGQPKLLSYEVRPVVPVGWVPRYSATFNWAKPLFGDASIWDRYSLTATRGGNLHTTAPVVVDVIDTPDLQSFSAYGVEACYQFHGYSLSDVAQVNLTGGVTGQSMSYTSQRYGSWSIVYWIVPVKLGKSTIYERVVLYVQNSGRGVQVPASSGSPTVTNVAGSLDAANPADVRLMRNRAFLVAFARQMIAEQARRSQHVRTITETAA